MSRIGKLPITIPQGVETKISDNAITVKGKLGELSFNTLPEVDVKIENNQIIIIRKDDQKKSRAIHGLTRAILNNMVEGVSKGFEKKLEIQGVGYNAKAIKDAVLLNLGFSHPIYFGLPEGITVETPEPTKISVKGVDKQLVGEVAAKIRKLRPPEPYKGKGIRYSDEIVRRKAGKTAGS